MGQVKMMKHNVQPKSSAYEQEYQLNAQIEAYWDERSRDFSKLRQKVVRLPGRHICRRNCLPLHP